jgi:hypothetical protein
MNAVVETVAPEALFKGAPQALRFAFNFAAQQYAKAGMAALMGSASRLGAGKGLVGLDGAAQAGLILRELAELPKDQRDCLTARYTERHEERTEWRLQAYTVQWADAIDAMTMFTGYLVTGMSHQQLRRNLVRRYFGDKIDMSAISQKVGVHRATANNHWAIFSKALRELESRALANIETRLADAGIVASEQ